MCTQWTALLWYSLSIVTTRSLFRPLVILHKHTFLHPTSIPLPPSKLPIQCLMTWHGALVTHVHSLEKALLWFYSLCICSAVYVCVVQYFGAYAYTYSAGVLWQCLIENPSWLQSCVVCIPSKEAMANCVCIALHIKGKLLKKGCCIAGHPPPLTFWPIYLSTALWLLLFNALHR